MINRDLFNKALKDSGKSLAAVSGYLGINPSTLYRKITGITDFSRNEIILMKDCLGLSENDLYAIFFDH